MIAISLLFFDVISTFLRPQMSDLRGDQSQVVYNSYIVGRKPKVEKKMGQALVTKRPYKFLILIELK